MTHAAIFAGLENQGTRLGPFYARLDVGVYIFFVISGYLITGILARELDEGRFSIRRFYERRVRRILPALWALLAIGVPVSWWLLAIPVIAIFGGEVFAGFGGIVPALVYGVLVAAVAAFLFTWGAARIEVAGGALRAGGAELRLTEIGEVIALDEKQSAQLRGPRADPAARLLLRPYLKRAVYLSVADPASEVPYWLVASRRPAEVAAAVERGRKAMGAVETGRKAMG